MTFAKPVAFHVLMGGQRVMRIASRCSALGVRVPADMLHNPLRWTSVTITSFVNAMLGVACGHDVFPICSRSDFCMNFESCISFVQD